MTFLMPVCAVSISGLALNFSYKLLSVTLMYLIPIAWIYVAVMMSVAEATSSNGTVIGAIFTFLIYGLMPVALLIYIMGTPGRKRKIKAREMLEREHFAAASAGQPAEKSANQLAEPSVNTPDASRHAAGDAVAPVGKEP